VVLLAEHSPGGGLLRRRARSRRWPQQPDRPCTNRLIVGLPRSDGFRSGGLGLEQKMMMERALKILMTGGVAILCALITAGNIHDPDANLIFVKHILSMDTIAANSPMADHAVTTQPLWRTMFWLMVAGEGLTATLFLWGTFELFGARTHKARLFHEAKRFVFAGVGCAFLIWFVGFLAVGGEWFAMWQSQVWNGQQAAFRIFMSILLVSMFVVLPDCEL
jgi:predicted small integral membrane protein